MTEKKSILLLASAAALTLALHESALSAPPVDEPAPPVSAVPTTPAAVESPAPEPAPPIPEAAGAGEPTAVSPETAAPPAPPVFPEPAPAGTPGETSTEPTAMVPEPPPPLQLPMPGTGGGEWGGMTAEERAAQREQRFQRMHERFMQRRQEMAERWDSYWKILDSMTPEQKEAIEAVFGHGKGRCSYPGMGPRMPSATPMQPQFGQPEYGFPSGSSFPGPGYGYGPQSTEPFPYERGAGASWPGEQPTYPGGFQPWYGGEQGSFQGPPPPSGNYGQSW